MNSLLVNLSVLINKPTGISTYAVNLLPHLQFLNPTLLVSPASTDAISTGGISTDGISTDAISTGGVSTNGISTGGIFTGGISTDAIYRVSTSFASEYNCYPIPVNLTPEYGTKGHLRRLLWTQLQLPRIYQKLRSPLLFSPLPEAPLYTKCRYIVTVHDLIPLRFPKPFSPLTPYHRYYIPQVLAQAQHVICNSSATAKDIIDCFDINPEKITPILLAHDANHFRRLNLPRLNYFLYIGRHDPHKNLHRVVAAFAALPNHQDYELWLAGTPDPRYTPVLEADIERLGIINQVKFLDYIPYSQLPTLINSAIALVFPSLWEGFGLPVLEAMACGTPVITSNISSLPEVAGDAALLVNPYNAGEIAEAMQTIAEDAEVRSRLSQLSIKRASQFSWDKTGLATVEVLKRYL